jgi:hypothetical protein
MRDSLRQSLSDRPGFERYPKGSIVVCHSCARPIYRLDAGIAVGDRFGQASESFKPVSLTDLEALQARQDIDAGLRGTLASWTPEQRVAHVQALREVRTGDPMVCPVCRGVFVQVLATEPHEVLDRAYTIEMLTIPPAGTKAWPLRGRESVWVH